MKQPPKKINKAFLTKSFWFITALMVIGAVILKGESFKINHYKVEIDIFEHGYFNVVETIAVDFSTPRHGLTRTLPLIRNDKIIIIDQLRVDRRNFRVEENNKRLKIIIGEDDKLIDKEQIYTIRYRVSGAINHRLSHSEFSWNLVGDGWDVPIDSIFYILNLPQKIDFSKEDATIQIGEDLFALPQVTLNFKDNVIYGSSIRALLPNEEVTLRMKLPKGSVNKFSTIKLLGRIGIIVLSFLPALIYFLLWWFGRNKQHPITPQPYPPEGISSAEAGPIIEEDTYETRLLISLIPYWGTRGFVQIKGKNQDIQLIKVQDLPPNTPYYEQFLFDSIFEKNTTILLSDLKGEMGVKMNRAKGLLKTEVKSSRFHSTFSLQYLEYNTPLVAGIGLISLGLWLIMTPNTFFVGVIVLFGAFLGFLLKNKMLKRNKKGQEIYEQVQGFKAFIDKADTYEIKQLIKENANYFQETFPYAIALGRKDMWVKKFVDLSYGNIDWFDVDSSNDTPLSIELLLEQLNEIEEIFTSGAAIPKRTRKKRFFETSEDTEYDYDDYDDDNDWGSSNDDNDGGISFFDSSHDDEKDGGSSW